jgi:heme/copper-type cytochrome/quinol oxidase subunit 2
MRNFDPPPPEVEEDHYIRNLIIVLCTVVPFGILLLVSVIVRFVCFMKKRKRLKQVEVEKKKKLES